VVAGNNADARRQVARLEPRFCIRGISYRQDTPYGVRKSDLHDDERRGSRLRGQPGSALRITERQCIARRAAFL
jgi:hypothetical protein